MTPSPITIIHRTPSGDRFTAKAVRITHLTTIARNDEPNIDVELYRLADGKLVVCKSYANDATIPPWTTDERPQQYGYQSPPTATTA